MLYFALFIIFIALEPKPKSQLYTYPQSLLALSAGAVRPAGLGWPLLEADDCASPGKKHAAVAGCRGLAWGWLLWLGSVLWELHFLIIKTQDAETVALVGFVSYTCSAVAQFHFLIIKVFGAAVWALTWKKLLEWSALQQQRHTPGITWSLSCLPLLPALSFLLKTNIRASLDL